MFHFQKCAKVPEQGGRRWFGGGLVEVKEKVVWKGVDCKLDNREVEFFSQRMYFLNEKNSQWERVHMSGLYGATIANCGGQLVAVGGCKNADLCSKEVIVFRDRKWTAMPDMLVGCRGSGVISTVGGGLVVMGGIGDGCVPLNVVQVFEDKTKTWHFGPSLPTPSFEMSATVHRDEVFVMGGRGMARAVWCANISKLVSHDAL